MEKEVLEKLAVLIEEGEKLKQIDDAWSSRVGTFLKMHFSKYKLDFYIKIKMDGDLRGAVGLLKDIKEFTPLVKNSRKKSTGNKNNFNVNISNSNYQSQDQTQSQEMEISVLIETIKNELTEKQQKEIKAILEDSRDDIEKAKPKIIEKLKSFGSDVASNILANIITNPNIWGGF